MKNFKFYVKSFSVGILFAAIFWFLESFVHFFFFNPRIHGFDSEVMPSDPNEIWMRIFIAILIIVLTLSYALFFRKKAQITDKMRLSFHALTVMREGCVITDSSNKIVYVNPRYERISGYSFAEVRGKNPSVSSSGSQRKEFYKKMWAELYEKGFWEGEIWNRGKSGKLYPEWINISLVKSKKGKVLYHVGVLSDITSKKIVEEKINHYAYYDPLTDLPNRRFFMEKLEQEIKSAKREEQSLCVLFIDLDYFKLINDEHGHVVGDQFLCGVSDKIKGLLRENDVLSRFGGDEFVVLLSNISSKDLAAQLANRLLKTLCDAPIEIGDLRLKVGLSIGGVVYPEGGMDAETLIKNADDAMYDVKNTTRHKVKFFKV